MKLRIPQLPAFLLALTLWLGCGSPSRADDATSEDSEPAVVEEEMADEDSSDSEASTSPGPDTTSNPFSLGVDPTFPGSTDSFSGQPAGTFDSDPDFSQVMSGVQGIVNRGIQSGESTQQMQGQVESYLDRIFGSMDANSDSNSANLSGPPALGSNLQKGNSPTLGLPELADGSRQKPTLPYSLGVNATLSAETSAETYPSPARSTSSQGPEGSQNAPPSSSPTVDTAPSSPASPLPKADPAARAQFEDADYKEVITLDDGKSVKADCSRAAFEDMKSRGILNDGTKLPSSAAEHLSTGLADYLATQNSQFVEVDDPTKAVNGGYIYFTGSDGKPHIEAVEGKDDKNVITWGCRNLDSHNANPGCGQGLFSYKYLNETAGSLRIFVPKAPATPAPATPGSPSAAQANSLSAAALQVLSSTPIPPF